MVKHLVNTVEEAELAETTVMKEEATMEYAGLEVVKSHEKTNQQDGEREGGFFYT